MNIRFSKKEEVQGLIEDEMPENQQLEYKEYKFENGKVDKKDEIIKEISALANAEGGCIIMGVKTNKGIPTKIMPLCKKIHFDEIQQAIMSSMQNKIRPRLYGITMDMIDIGEENIIISINVPKSYNRPHAFNDGSKDIFSIRHSNITSNMSVDELRRQFIFNASYKTEIKQFRQDRISMILANKCIDNLQKGAKVLLHIIPLWSLDAGNIIDIKLLTEKEMISEIKPISEFIPNRRYNSDGLYLYCKDYQKNITYSYIQFYRNGIIEAVDTRLINSNDKDTCRWRMIEKYLYRAIVSYSKIIKELSVPKQWYIYISLLDAKGFYLLDSYGDKVGEAVDKEVINSIECIWENENQNIDSVIKPAFDSISNSFGFEKSFMFDNNGIYIP